MTLFVTLNSSNELLLEHDYNDGRETLIEDAGGPTSWSGVVRDWGGVPERVEELVREAYDNEMAKDAQNRDIELLLNLNRDATFNDVVDDR